MRLCDERSECCEVDLDLLVVNSILISLDLGPCVFPVLSLEESSCYLVRGEDGSRCAELGAHVCDGCTLRNRQCLNAVACILDDLAYTALNGHDAENFEDDVLCSCPVAELVLKGYTDHPRHCNVVRTAAHCYCYVKSACSDSEHADTAACRSMGVRTEKCLSRDTETLNMNLVANAVTGTAESDAVLCSYCLDVLVVVSVLKACLKHVVIDISN